MGLRVDDDERHIASRVLRFERTESFVVGTLAGAIRGEERDDRQRVGLHDGVEGNGRAVGRVERDARHHRSARGRARRERGARYESHACDHEKPARSVSVTPIVAGWFAPSVLTGGVRKREPWMRTESERG